MRWQCGAFCRFPLGGKGHRMLAMSLLHNQPRLSYSDQDGEHSVPLERDSTGIGRSPDQDLVLHEPFVSRRHALIQRKDGHFELVDQKSSHGTYVNGARVERATLHPGDMVQFGSLSSAKFQFLLDTGLGSTATHSL